MHPCIYRKFDSLTSDIYVMLQLLLFLYFGIRAFIERKKTWPIDRTVLLKDRAVLYKAWKLRPWGRKKLMTEVSLCWLFLTEVSFFFLTELSFSAKKWARSVLFPLKFFSGMAHRFALVEMCYSVSAYIFCSNLTILTTDDITLIPPSFFSRYSP